MSNFAFNIAKGRGVEFYHRVKANDPANSALIVVPLAVTDTQANLQDLDNLSVILAGTPDAVGAAWGAASGRKTLTDIELATDAPDDTNDRYPLALPSLTWTAVPTGNNAVALLVCYDSDTTTGTDTAIIPITHHDFNVITDGNDVVLNTGDFLRSS